MRDFEPAIPRCLILFLMVVLTSAPTHAQEAIIEVRPLADLIGESTNALDTATLAPDGEHIAYIDDVALCLLHIATENADCTPLPETFFGIPLRLHWSPDSAQIAFTEWWSGNQADPDIWLWDGETIRNRTDDEVSRLLPDDTTLTVDYSPFWSPDGTLYFFRSERVENGWDIRLMRLTGDGAETMRDLSLPALSVVDANATAFFDGAVSVSPDGTTVAVSVVNATDITAEDNGVYTFALDDDSPVVQHTPALYNAGMPDWTSPEASFAPYLITGLTWHDDALFVGTLHVLILRFRDLISNGIFRIDLESDTVTPRFDYTGFATRDDFNIAANAGFPDGDFVPNYAVLLDDETLIALSNTDAGQIIWTAPVDDGEPVAIWRGALDQLALPEIPPSVSVDGRRVLIGGLLVSLSGTG